MKKTAYPILLSLLLSILIGIIMACTPNPSSSSSSSLDETTVRAYADPATETTLQGLSESDMAKYTRYATDEFKAAVTQEILDQTAAQLNSQLGTYQSKEFLSIEEQEGYIIVHYKAKYTKGDVGIRMVFDKEHQVAGQWFE